MSLFEDYPLEIALGAGGAIAGVALREAVAAGFGLDGMLPSLVVVMFAGVGLWECYDAWRPEQ